MEITLTPSELYQVNSIQSKNTIRVLPKGKHKQSKVVVGDSNGALTCFGVKKGSSRKEWIFQQNKMMIHYLRLHLLILVVWHLEVQKMTKFL